MFILSNLRNDVVKETTYKKSNAIKLSTLEAKILLNARTIFVSDLLPVSRPQVYGFPEEIIKSCEIINKTKQTNKQEIKTKQKKTKEI